MVIVLHANFGPPIWSTCVCGKRSLTDKKRAEQKACFDLMLSCGFSCDGELRCVEGHSGGCGECMASVEAECRYDSAVMTFIFWFEIGALRQIPISDKKCNDGLLGRKQNCEAICRP